MTKREIALYITYVALIFTAGGCVSKRTLKRAESEAYAQGTRAGEEKKEKECTQTLENAFKAFEASQATKAPTKAPKKAKRIAKKAVVEPCK